MTFDGIDSKNLERIANFLYKISESLDGILDEIKKRPYVRPPDFSVSNPFTRDTGTGDARRL